MSTPLPEAKSLLAVEVGEITTRAVLFDVVEGRYRFIALGSVSTTAKVPLRNVAAGVKLAIRQLEKISGRKFLRGDGSLLTPTQADGQGIDLFVVTTSAGPPLKIVAFGLLQDVSLASACELAETIYAQVIEKISLNDHRKPEDQLDAIIGFRPDVIILAGGTEGGAKKSLTELVEIVSLACAFLPEDQRPEVLYVGNKVMADEIQDRLGSISHLHFAANIRPSLDYEQIEPAQIALADIFRLLRKRQINGFSELDSWSGNQLTPTATAFGRVIRFLSKVYDPGKGVLGIDVGASATTIAAAFSGELSLRVFSPLGMGEGLQGVTDRISLEQIAQWLPLEVGEEYLQDYIHNKIHSPGSLPVTQEELAIELALARQVIRQAIQRTQSDSLPLKFEVKSGVLPAFEPILAAGSVITRAPSYGQSLLLLLDALQPTGITTFVLDQSNLTAPLGAASVFNPLLVVQILESSAFLSLATIISPVVSASPGTPVMHVRVIYESGDEVSFEVKYGTLEALPLPMGQSARIRIQPMQRADVGMGGPGRGGTVRVVGGALGVVIDARGRPLQLPDDAGRRRELFKKWLWTLGG